MDLTGQAKLNILKWPHGVGLGYAGRFKTACYEEWGKPNTPFLITSACDLCVCLSWRDLWPGNHDLYRLQPIYREPSNPWDCNARDSRLSYQASPDTFCVYNAPEVCAGNNFGNDADHSGIQL